MTEPLSSNSVLRYVCESCDGSPFHMHEHPRGNFVRIEHHEAEIDRLTAERDALIKTLTRWIDAWENGNVGQRSYAYEKAKEALRAADECLTEHTEEVNVPFKVTDEMVTRFLGWRLPDDFDPDCGITFKKLNHPTSWPVGTNLLNAVQAKAMLEYVLGGAGT